MKYKTAILGIDIQNDFTLPEGALYVQGSEKDSIRTAAFIDMYRSTISYIALTLDSHKSIHIGTQHYWRDKEGYPPALFSVVTAKEVAEGKWIPQYNVKDALPYLKELESKGEVNSIWPAHCIYGSSGWAINAMVMRSIYTWGLKINRSYELFYKGMQESVEQYSIFSSIEGFETEHETKTRDKLLNKLREFDRIILLGQAADFCVVNTLTDLLEIAPEFAKKIVILTDCMSWINPNNERATYLYEMAKSKGVRFATSENYNILDKV